MTNQHQHQDCEEDIMMLDAYNQNNRSALPLTQTLVASLVWFPNGSDALSMYH